MAMSDVGQPEEGMMLAAESDGAPSVPVRMSIAKRAGFLLAGLGACALCVGGAVHWASERGMLRGSARDAIVESDASQVAGLECGIDYVIKEVVRNNIGDHKAHQKEGLLFKVKRHGGGAKIENFVLMVHALGKVGGSRSQFHDLDHPNLWKLHVDSNEPLHLEFSLWDEKMTKKIPLRSFGISIFDLDTSYDGKEREYAIAKPSMIARLGSQLTAEGIQDDKVIVRAVHPPASSLADGPEMIGQLTNAQKSNAVRFIYNNVDDFVITLGFTGTGSREIAFSMHDPDNCEDPILPKAHLGAGSSKDGFKQTPS